MGAAADVSVCMEESRRGGMFAKVRAKNPFSFSLRKDEKSQEPNHGSSPSPATAKSPATEDSMPETIVLLLLDRFAPS